MYILAAIDIGQTGNQLEAVALGHWNFKWNNSARIKGLIKQTSVPSILASVTNGWPESFLLSEKLLKCAEILVL